MIKKLQKLKCKTKLKFHLDFSNFLDGTIYLMQSGNFHVEENTHSINEQGIAFIKHETLLLLKLLQMIPPIKKRIIKCYDLFYNINLKLSDGEEIEVS